MARKLRALDLFAGCGGLSKGFEKAGFDIVVANEIWHPAAESFRLNHPNAIMIEGDITNPEIKAKVIAAASGEVDVIIGGPPCQAYSMAGKRDPTDPRGKLFEDYVEIVAAIRPPVFVMENVKGILTIFHDRDDLTESERKLVNGMHDEINEIHEILKRNNIDTKVKATYKKKISRIESEILSYQEKVVDMIVRRFRSIGYRVENRILNAADYGVPQKRERVIFIGTNTDMEIVFPFPTHSEKPVMTIYGEMQRPWRTVKDAIDDLKHTPENPVLHHILPHHSAEFRKKIRNTPLSQGVFPTYSDAFFRCSPDEPSRTVKENHNGVFVHYEEDRVMTARELARLQDFGDDFIFSGSKSIVLKQIGNAVPVGLGMAVGIAVRKMLDARREKDRVAEQGQPIGAYA